MSEIAVQELFQIVSICDNSHVSVANDKRQSYFRQKWDAVEALVRMCKEQNLDFEDFKINRTQVLNCVSNGGIRYYFKLEPFYGSIR